MSGYLNNIFSILEKLIKMKPFFLCGCDFIQASLETNVKAKGRAKQTREQSKRAIPGETK
jgi:hypothetical protein